MSPAYAYEVVWTGELETAAIKAQQRMPVEVTAAKQSRQAIVRERILTFLRQRPGASVQALMDNLGFHRDTVNTALSTLERGGWIERSSQDRSCATRPVVFHVTR